MVLARWSFDGPGDVLVLVGIVILLVRLYRQPAPTLLYRTWWVWVVVGFAVLLGDALL